MSNAIIHRPVNAIALPDNKQWTERFEIRSETSNRVYVIAKNKYTGKFACSCPGWKAHRHCKHLTKGCGLPLTMIHGNGQIEDSDKDTTGIKQLEY